jgi:ribosome biogenesis GTPase
LEGIVIKSTGSWYHVQTETGEIYECKIKGRFRIDGIRSTNPIAVGDKVVFKLLDKKGVGLITQIKPRDNYLVRKSSNLSKASHIIAANIDQALLIITTAQPRTLTGFIDRFLVTAEAYHIPVKIIFNKLDLYDKEAEELDNHLFSAYSKIGYECMRTSAIRGDNMDMLSALMKNKVSLLSGHSGVGKSALVNAIQPGLKLKTGEISEYHNKGKHTTTFAEMHPLDIGGYIIDTPGIKGFGLYDFVKDEVAERFPEMREYMVECRFNNCTHTHEPDCAVKAAVEAGEIEAFRYQNYLNILDDDYLDVNFWENK